MSGIKDRERYNAYMRKYMGTYYVKKRDEYRDYLGGQCAVCGSRNDLEFHHKDPSIKSFTITKLFSIKWSKAQPELDKCELRCQEHHKEVHAAKRGGWRRYYKERCRCDRCVEWHRDIWLPHVRERRRKKIQKDKGLRALNPDDLGAVL